MKTSLHACCMHARHCAHNLSSPAMKQCTLSIPPSSAIGAQMLSNDVKETSNIANVNIYVEQAIGWLKDFRILKIQQPL